ncbi:MULTISPECIES: hypothetical protein [unclassified Paenibacillus]|uniref:hypothetical protein n=1 Tax=unclassified Paenibacillus TaxID=185978 RepID=UPI000954865C|nr:MULTISPECIES: hypothetical protein [unclassified Paenibacillus]ASS66375.1 hypothetical protein CIC07_09585 [Paenibacillus sp. RUD330]SIQ06342.1 hypothetical protein SAMN05880555_0504 [Paenibacillus sp. RU4X]SIQ26466.1 hypothetical protein SAMN05880570_0503 [Paenibacillus sp. RU4T]
MSNFKQKTITTKSGQAYTLQHPGVRAVTKITDRVKNKYGVMSDEKLADEMLAHVVVDPKRKVDDFDSYRELVEVVQEAYKFVTGIEDEAGND